MKKAQLTPLMEQYWLIKNQHLDKVLMFQMGDFFEMFYDDAVKAAPILNIALTSRSKQAENQVPMCGVPCHSVAIQIARLLAAGCKVALCEQVEPASQSKKLVARKVTQVLSPGMVYDPETLEAKKANYLCAVDPQGLAFLDISTGEAFYYSLLQTSEVWNLIAILQPVELVLSAKQKHKLFEKQHPLLQRASVFELNADVKATLAPQVLRVLPCSPADCVLRLTAYVQHMQGEEAFCSVEPFVRRDHKRHMELGPLVLRHLEVFEPQYTSSTARTSKGSLFYAINRTRTAAGARLLRQWLSFPLREVTRIQGRQDQVQKWIQNLGQLKKVREQLGQLGDIERRMSRFAKNLPGAQEFLTLNKMLKTALQLLPLGGVVGGGHEGVQKLTQSIDQSFDSTGHLRPGVNKVFDACHARHSQALKKLEHMEQQEAQSTLISSLKIRYNHVFGYYIEVTKTHLKKVPSRYERKQTLANAERYITPELRILEAEILKTTHERKQIQTRVLEQLRDQVLQQAVSITLISRELSRLDVLTSFAWLALNENYVRPEFVADTEPLLLENSRHLVVEQEMRTPFVPNTLQLNAGGCLLLTGPNMAGKSTLMRQVAVTALLAQVGCFVPAQRAQLPIFDRVFTRIGASDSLAEGVSTFMVEMREVSQLLQGAGPRSLIILDEVGRGTSTYDGVSLAQAILEFLFSRIKARVLFATHYHELVELAKTWPQVQNAHMGVQQLADKKEIRFLYTLQPGAAEGSFGLHVAEKAGLPPEVVQRAHRLLQQYTQ